MKRLLIASLLGSFAFAAAAQSTTAADVDAQARVETETATADATVELDTRAELQQDVDRDCIRYTGSRITSRITARRTDETDCVIAHGRVYTREDLDRTGEINIVDALRRLDPSIR
ncbi:MULTISPECIES: hypothetical protein [Novilysobacter]|uniref:hypothetical protein n=1 Tax=Novilysobacter TaxID=3382699 RepID=UPI002ED927F4